MLRVSWLAGTFATTSLRRLVSKMGSVCMKTEINDQVTIDALAGKASDIGEGQMKEVQLSKDISVLLVKNKGKISAVGNKCTHYGAPLAKGSFCPEEGIIRCPWHGACFDATTGDIEDFPGLDSLPCYSVEELDNGDIRVTGSYAKVGNQSKRVKNCTITQLEEKTVVIVGGGGAAQVCAETLRTRAKSPWNGRIIMICKEDALPYDRPKLSKAMTSSPADLQLRPLDFYKSIQVEALTGVEVTKVLPSEKRIQVKGHDQESIKYDFLVLASGGQPRDLDVSGHDLSNIHHLRTPSDANNIAKAATGKNVTIVGGSFIGTEVAAFLSDKAASVTIICRTQFLLERSLGPEIGKFVQALHESKGVKIISNSNVVKLAGKEDESSQVGFVHVDTLEEPIATDLVILGVGVVPSTSYAQDTSIPLDQAGNIEVNEHMQCTNDAAIFAAGDIANFPLKISAFEPENVAIGHWQIAQTHGRTVGLNIGLPEENMSHVHTVPFFWTVQYGKSIRYAGYAHTYDDIVYDGDVGAGSFVAYFCQNDVVKAVATLGRDPVAADFANYLLAGKVLQKSEAAEGEWKQ